MATFGATTGATGTSTNIESNIVGSRFTCTEDGIITGMKAYLNVTLLTKQSKCAVYKYSDLSLVGFTNNLASGTGTFWRSYTPSSPIPIMANTEYILVVWCEASTGNAYVTYENGTANQGQLQSLGYGASFPDPLVPTSSDNNQYQIYAIYTPALKIWKKMTINF